MSVSLNINWPDGKFESVPIAGQLVASTHWRAFGRELGLEWVPRFAGWVPVDQDNLGQLISELQTLQSFVEAKGAEWQWMAADVTNLRSALLRLRESTGWDASSG